MFVSKDDIKKEPESCQEEEEERTFSADLCVKEELDPDGILYGTGTVWWNTGSFKAICS